MVTYVSHNNLLGQKGLTSAYAFANRPADGRPYRPATQYSSSHGATATVRRLGPGQYEVTFNGSGGPVQANGGDVQASAVGSSDRHCFVGHWVQGTNPRVYIDCVTNLGAPADSPFTIQWVVA